MSSVMIVLDVLIVLGIVISLKCGIFPGRMFIEIFNGLIIQNFKLQIRVITPEDVFSGLNVAL